MADSVPKDLFFDRSVAGVLVASEEEAEAYVAGASAVRNDRFYRNEGRAGHGGFARWIMETASRPMRLAAAVFGIGFFAVFVNQAPLLYQVVLGAPIFEELVKFGLALLIAWPLRFLALRLPVAWAVGGGFGVLEHFVTYSAEPTWILVARILFHGGATGLSMACWHLLEQQGSIRSRLGSTLLATGVHYANNALAVVLSALVWLPGLGTVSAVVFIATTAAGFALTVAVLGLGPRFVVWMDGLTARHLRGLPATSAP